KPVVDVRPKLPFRPIGCAGSVDDPPQARVPARKMSNLVPTIRGIDHSRIMRGASERGAVIVADLGATMQRPTPMRESLAVNGFARETGLGKQNDLLLPVIDPAGIRPLAVRCRSRRWTGRQGLEFLRAKVPVVECVVHYDDRVEDDRLNVGIGA